MELSQAKNKFIGSWKILGQKWGFEPDLAQIHAVLLISPQPLTINQIQTKTGLNSININNHIIELIKWGVIEETKSNGEPAYLAEKEMWELAKHVARERQRRELLPLMAILEEIQLDNPEQSEEAKSFTTLTRNLHRFSGRVNGMIERFIKADQNWFFKSFLSFLK
jgi:DNA-binding transcriptional regulator GbsR (MarR family)